jgi:hypothetical protein
MNLSGSRGNLSKSNFSQYGKAKSLKKIQASTLSFGPKPGFTLKQQRKILLWLRFSEENQSYIE